jgi:hypothetical protein
MEDYNHVSFTAVPSAVSLRIEHHGRGKASRRAFKRDVLCANAGLPNSVGNKPTRTRNKDASFYSPFLRLRS